MAQLERSAKPMRISTISFFLVTAFGALTCCAAEMEAPLALSIVPESSHDNGGPWIRGNTSFYVVLTNRSGNPVRVWSERCSWGYSTLSLEAKLPDGKELTIQKRLRDWASNAPDHFVIVPGSHFVMPVKLKSEWVGYPTKQQKLMVRARYQIVADEQSREHGVWTGEIVSAWLDATISE